MLKSISVIVMSFAASARWGCGGEHATRSQMDEAHGDVGQPLSKLAVRGHMSSEAVVVVTMWQKDAPVSGARVEFSRSIAGRAPDYQWSGMTDDMGRARVEIAAKNVTGYYRARASRDGIGIGSWSSIPVNAGYMVMLNLPIGGKARVTSSSMLTEPAEFTRANVATGGALYDKWWVVAGVSEPSDEHPLWAQRPDKASNTRLGSTTHRCKECHGWDYKGVNGAYSTGSHRTGFPGIRGTTKSPQEIFDLLKNAHGFGALGLSDTALWDATKFVLEGAIDTDQIIDQAGAFTGNRAGGKAPYDRSCVSCHGADGLTNPFDAIPNQPGSSPGYDHYPQVVANDNPWEFQHKVRFGQPGTNMPLLVAENITPTALANLGAYVQSLPASVASQKGVAEVKR